MSKESPKLCPLLNRVTSVPLTGGSPNLDQTSRKSLNQFLISYNLVRKRLLKIESSLEKNRELTVSDIELLTEEYPNKIDQLRSKAFDLCIPPDSSSWGLIGRRVDKLEQSWRHLLEFFLRNEVTPCSCQNHNIDVRTQICSENILPELNGLTPTEIDLKFASIEFFPDSPFEDISQFSDNTQPAIITPTDDSLQETAELDKNGHFDNIFKRNDLNGDFDLWDHNDKTKTEEIEEISSLGDLNEVSSECHLCDYGSEKDLAKPKKSAFYGISFGRGRKYLKRKISKQIIRQNCGYKLARKNNYKYYMYLFIILLIFLIFGLLLMANVRPLQHGTTPI